LRLSELVEDAEMARSGATEFEITGITCDSRAVEPGFVFAALPGARTDGARFIGEAARRGARVVLAAPAAAAAAGRARLPLVAAADPRRRYAQLAARFFGPQPRVIAAVTGTNGKTSVVSFARQIWQRLGRPAASLGTLGVSAPLASVVPLTTPDPADLHRTLAALARAGVGHVALEASSHGLAQRRCDGVELAAAAFTNLSRDHLDYHHTEDDYFAAKARLFGELLPAGGAAVLNADSQRYEALARLCRERGHRIVTYGTRRDEPADVALLAAERTVDGQRLVLAVGGERHEARCALVGDFQAANLLCALALVVACGDDAGAAAATLGEIEATPGRLERVAGHPAGASVFVDYAHTPAALEAALRALRPYARGRLHVVFGCGGERDPGKRPQMGAIAAELADRVIVTDDNPRGEDPAAIRAAVLAACPGAEEVGERGEAIVRAVAALGPGDVLVIAGKGHETGQIVASATIPFDDRRAAREALAALAVGERR
jgi:UDP-N-acetylmuramoyl-L-alanyl-D-glutamate--2,6-diaminopimelate ligase